MNVLGGEPDQHVLLLDDQLDGAQRGERGRHHDLGPLVVIGLEAIRQFLDHLDRLQMVHVHLPVPHHEGLAVGQSIHLSSTATPGNSRPSNNSRPAPPPLNTWETHPPSPKSRMAPTETPPPMAVNPSQSAMARATATVPSRNGSHSKTPMGPFQNTDSAPRTIEANVSE